MLFRYSMDLIIKYTKLMLKINIIIYFIQILLIGS